MTWTEWAGIASTFGFGVMGVLKFLQARQVDAHAARSGLLTNNREGTGQLIGGYSGLVDQLQEEVVHLRGEVTSRGIRIDTLTLEVARLKRKYGENGDTPLPPSKAQP